MPTIRILVCADVDLKSCSDLCEYILQQEKQKFDPSMIDMVLVCGPLASESDTESFCPVLRPTEDPHQHHDYPAFLSPFLESREKAAARQGLITACLSQLENIVCRVVFVAGATDPRSTSNTMRMTPNSRNIEQQWLRIVPGLGCAGLRYLDGMNALLEELGAPSKNEEEEGNSPDGDSDSSRSSSSAVVSLVEKIRALPER